MVGWKVCEKVRIHFFWGELQEAREMELGGHAWRLLPELPGWQAQDGSYLSDCAVGVRGKGRVLHSSSL